MPVVVSTVATVLRLPYSLTALTSYLLLLPSVVNSQSFVTGWREDAETLTRVYKQVPERRAGKPRVFSKLKLVAALKAADKWVLVKTWIEERGLWDYYLAAQNFREDNEMFSEALAAVKAYARMADEDAEAILANCIWEED